MTDAVIDAEIERMFAVVDEYLSKCKREGEVERLRAAVTMGMHYLKGRYPVPVKEKEVLAAMQAALDGKEKP